VKTALKILIHTGFPVSIAVCWLAGAPVALLACGIFYFITIDAVHA
jgi:hypothetical protein